MKKLILLALVAIVLVFTSCATNGLIGPGGDKPPKSLPSHSKF